MKSQLIANEVNNFCNNLDMDFQVDFVKAYEKIGDSPIFGGKHCGSDAEHEGSRFIADKLREIGVPEVEMLPFDTCRYQFNGAEIKLPEDAKGADGRSINAYGYASPGTSEGGITAEAVYADTSYMETYETLNTKGKIAIIKGMDGLEGENVTEQLQEAELHGAVGILIYMVDDILDDDLVRVQYPRYTPRIPILAVSKAAGEYIKRLTEENEGMKLTMTVDADYQPHGGTTYNVLGTIPGNSSDEQIVFTAHLDHFFKCLQDNMASCATVLGIAKAMMDSGYKPNRTIHFAFHGSHECGLTDSKFSYILGAYNMAHRQHPEWGGKTIAQINFEYTALSLKKLYPIGTIGTPANVLAYNEYAPELVGGFESHIDELPPAWAAAMLTYCDAIGYLTAGIPAYTNEVMSEQLFEPLTSPYCGRDHSTRDDWDIFDVKALEDSARYYGGFGIYLDQLPYVTQDYSGYEERIRYSLDDESIKELESTGIKMKPYMDALAKLTISAKALYEELQKANEVYLIKADAGISTEEKVLYFQKAEAMNKKVLEIFDYFQKNLEKVTTGGLLYMESQKYMETIVYLLTAVEHLKKGDIEKALKEGLAYVDLAGKSLYFSEEIVEHRRHQSEAPEYAESRTWAKGREVNTCLTLYPLVQSLKAKQKKGRKNCRKEILQIYIVMLKELGQLKRALKEEINHFDKGREKIEQIHKNL